MLLCQRTLVKHTCITVLSVMAIPGFIALHSIPRAGTQDFHYGTRNRPRKVMRLIPSHPAACCRSHKL